MSIRIPSNVPGFIEAQRIVKLQKSPRNVSREPSLHIPSDVPGFLRAQSPVTSGLVPRSVSREPYRSAQKVVPTIDIKLCR
ncbi:MAG: hypothetical protein LBF66_03230 [Holosporales bacterium]|nr:hypothetical protein [Holosporales bacterium]